MDAFANLVADYNALSDELAHDQERLGILELKLRNMLVRQTEEIHDYQRLLDSPEIARLYFEKSYFELRKTWENVPPWKWEITLPFHRDASKQELRASTMSHRAASKVSHVSRLVGNFYKQPSRPSSEQRGLGRTKRFRTQAQLTAEIAQLRPEITAVMREIAEKKRLLHSGGYASTLNEVRTAYRALAIQLLYELLVQEDAPVAHPSGDLYTLEEIQLEHQRQFRYGRYQSRA